MKSNRRFIAVLIFLVIVFGIVIASAARNDLWFDECWSMLRLMENAASPLDFFYSDTFKHANNHVLMSLYMYFVQKSADPLVIRLLSVLSGVFSLLLAAGIAYLESGKVASILALVLTGSSFVMTYYFSEARGYAPLICMSLAAYFSLRIYQKKHSRTALAAFWLTSVTGFLAHSIFLISSISYAALTVYVPASSDNFLKRFRLKGFLIHLPVWGFFSGGIYILFPDFSWAAVLRCFLRKYLGSSVFFAAGYRILFMAV